MSDLKNYADPLIAAIDEEIRAGYMGEEAVFRAVNRVFRGSSDTRRSNVYALIMDFLTAFGSRPPLMHPALIADSVRESLR